MAKKNKAEAILTRAEKLFNIGNFLLAEKEYTKIQNKIDRVDIDQRLEVCRQETRTIKAKQLIKDGHKAVQKGNISQAISFFQDAHALQPTPDIIERIKELQDRLTQKKRGDAAQKAAADHDYSGAAALYARAWEETGEQEFLLKYALNLVKAQKYKKAVEQFAQLDHPNTEADYAWGFALAKTQRYCEAINQWANLNLHDHSFVKQKEHLFERACTKIYTGLNNNTDVQACLNDATLLLGMTSTLGSPCQAHIPALEAVCKYCRLQLLENFWEQEEFMKVADILKDMESSTHPELLALHAKCYYHLSQEQVDFLEPMMTFWLTAIYSRQISDKFSNNPDIRKKIQEKLIRMAEQRIHGFEDMHNTRQAAAYLEIEKEMINDLSIIAQRHPTKPCFISTPGYARLSGSSDDILNLIRENRNYFKDEAHYLETGGYYSRASEALYALRTGENEKAMSYVDAIDTTNESNEFIDYVSRIVNFKYGLFAIKNKNKSFLKHFKSTHKLFVSVPSLEKKFTDLMLQYDGDQILLYEELLLYLHKQHPSDLIDKALSLIMAESAIYRYNSKKINNKQVKVALEKALKLDENNALAHETLAQTCSELEIKEILFAIDRNKLNKAARIAAGSAYSEVYDAFFKFTEDLFNDFMNVSNTANSTIKNIFFNNLLNAVSIVDPTHPFINKIQAEIERI